MNEATKFFLVQNSVSIYFRFTDSQAVSSSSRMSTTNSGSESSDASVARSEKRENGSGARSRSGSSPSVSVPLDRMGGKVIVAAKQVRRSKTSLTSGQKRNESKQKVSIYREQRHVNGRSIVLACRRPIRADLPRVVRISQVAREFGLSSLGNTLLCLWKYIYISICFRCRDRVGQQLRVEFNLVKAG